MKRFSLLLRMMKEKLGRTCLLVHRHSLTVRLFLRPVDRILNISGIKREIMRPFTFPVERNQGYGHMVPEHGATLFPCSREQNQQGPIPSQASILCMA